MSVNSAEFKKAVAPIAPRLKLDPDRLLKVGGAHDPLSARLVERAGFPAVWLSGFCVSASYLGMPDSNLLTMSESTDVARRVAAAVTIPVIVDADNGFGDAMNTARAVREYGMGGVAGVCIEDNIFPKRCSLYAGAARELLSVKEMCEKLASAKKVAAQFGMLLIGRVESLIAGFGIEDAVTRANAYAEAGVDAVLIHSRSFAPLREITMSKRLTRPLVLVPTLFPQTPFSEMQEHGIAMAIYANQLMRAMVRAGQIAMERLLQAQSLSDADDLLVSVDDINHLVGVPAEWRAEKPSKENETHAAGKATGSIARGKPAVRV